MSLYYNKIINFKLRPIFSGLTISLIILCGGCRKAVEVPPPISSIAGSAVYTTDGTAMAVVTGIYSSLMNGGGIVDGAGSLHMTMGLAADELKNYSTSIAFVSPYTNAFLTTSSYFWPEIYEDVYTCNSIIQGVSASASLSAGIKNQVLGEAKFMRAFLMFYATNLYGDVPMPTTTDYQTNNRISRTPQTQVYTQIINDLKDARNLLSASYLNSVGGVASDRLRPNKYAAAALLARVYLYTKDWANAEAQADSVIANTSYTLPANLSQVFLSTSKEAIWQLQPVVPGYNTYNAYYFILGGTPGPVAPAAVSPYLLNAFETGDLRKSNWVGSVTVASSGSTYYFPYKYKVSPGNTSLAVTEDMMVLRLAEQYLIRAEARAQQNNLAGATSDLNVIRTRAGLSGTTAVSQSDLLSAVAHERQVELFTEWGDRWFNLKRTGSADAVMSVVTPQKGGTWAATDQLLPLPKNEIVINSNLIQNPGY
jgi:hypothetical protein